MNSIVNQPIFDVHAHLISDDPEQYPYSPLGGVLDQSVLVNPMTSSRFREEMDVCGVHRAVVVQRAHIYGGDNRYVVDCADDNPNRFGALVLVRSDRTDAAEEVSKWVGRNGAVGVRLTAPSRAPSFDWLSSRLALRIWDEVANLGATIRVHFYGWNREAGLKQLCQLALKYRDVPIVLDHLSNIVADDTRYAGIDDALKAVSDLPNVSLIYSSINAAKCLGAQVSLSQVLDDVITVFGPDRLMWGSDVGQTKHPYSEMVETARHSIAHLPEYQRSQILWETADRIYGSRFRA